MGCGYNVKFLNGNFTHKSIMTKQVFQPSVKEDLNRPHRVTLTEGQISTILYVLEGYIQGSDEYHFNDDFTRDMDKIFEELQGVVDNYYEEK